MSSTQFLGSYTAHSFDAETLVISTQNVTVNLCLLNNGALKVQYLYGNEVALPTSFAVNQPASLAAIHLQETENELFFETENYVVRFQKADSLLVFTTLQGECINQDEKGFGVVRDGSETTVYKQLQPGERFMGLGEKTFNLDKAGSQFVNWNTDQFGYHGESDPLYASVPFFIGIAHNRPYGIFLNNSSKTIFNFGASNNRFSFFQSTTGILEYYFFYTGDVRGVIAQYTALTGRIELPPLWSLGYQQCRYSYYPDTEVLSVARTFREKKIPADVIYLDIHYMQNYKVFTWQGEWFSNPKELIVKLNDLGFKVVVIIDPGVKIEAGYEVYLDGVEKDVFVKYPDGTLYEGQAWPGWCHFPDFTAERTRSWWAGYVKTLVEGGVAGIWNDMNEPAVWGKNFPDITEFDMDGNPSNHKLAHNLYGAQMARASFEGCLKASSKRPFVLTRAAFAGSQRHTAIWTGDNNSNEEHLLLGARMVNGLGLSGMPFNGNDVGGFIGECSIELFCRWIALGAFTPLYRGHTMVNSRDTEPWAFGEEAEDIARNYIGLRYRLLPYIYSAFYQAAQSGLPINRTLAIDFTDDWHVFTPEFQNEYMFGDALLVCPVLPNKNYHKLYLPAGTWYDFYTDEKYEGGKEILFEANKEKQPVFVKAGGILTLQSLVQSTAEAHDATLEVHVYKGLANSFELYEDDGLSIDSATSIRTIHYDGVAAITIGAAEGEFISKWTTAKCFLHGFAADENVLINGEVLPCSTEDYRFVAPVSNFDPFWSGQDESKTVWGLRVCEVKL